VISLGDDVKERMKKYVFTAVAMGYSEPGSILRLLKRSNYQVTDKEIEGYFKELESEGLITRSQNRLLLTEKGLDTMRKTSIEEDIVKNLLENTKLPIKLFHMPPPKLALSRLESTSIDAESLSTMTNLAVLKPLLIPGQKPKLTPLDTYKPMKDELIKWLFEIPVPKLINLTIPRPRLFQLNLEQISEEIKITPVKPFIIRFTKPKLASIDNSTTIQQPTVPHTSSVEKPVSPRLAEDYEDASISEGDVSDIIEGFFEVEEAEDKLGVAGIMYDRPVIIVAIRYKDYEYIDVLRYILRVLYRIAVGGFSQGEYLTPNPSLTSGHLRTNLEVEKAYFDSTRQGVIKVLDLTGIKTRESISYEFLRNRLKEHLVEGLSFTVIYVDEDIGEDVIGFLNKFRSEFGADVIVVRPRILPLEQLVKLAALAWGYTGIPEKECLERERPLNLNSVFTCFAEKFYRDLRRVYRSAMEKGIVEIVKPSRSGAGQESAEHYLLKVFAAYYFAEKEKVGIGDIAVEEPICGQAIPDVYIRSRGIAIEVETLYGEGPAWPSKLRETIEKYKGCSEVSEVWLVIPPLQASVYSKYLVSMLKRLRESRVIQAGTRLLTVDLEDEKFVSIAKMSKQVKDYLKPRQTPHEFFK
jgi:predicted transcriptional regulator